MKRVNIVSLTDWHIPYEDKVALELAFKFCEEMQPEIIVIHEAHDFEDLSRFEKDPEKGLTLQKEIDTVNSYLTDLRRRCPKARIVFLGSNHLARLKKYLWAQAPALSGLENLKLENLLGFKKNKIEFKPTFVFRNYLFKHGSIVRAHSSYTAKAEFEREGMSGCSGHTHRLGIHYNTRRGGAYSWMECGCLCKVNAEYIDGVANWQQGFGLVTFLGSNYTAIPIPIVNKEIAFGDIRIK